MTEALELKITRNISAAPKSVFEAWLTEDAIKNFMCPMEGVVITKAEVAPKENGKFSIVMKAGEMEIPIHGVYKKIDKYKELSFSWLSPHASENSFVTLYFKELSESETELTLHHTGFADEESRNNHEGGWNRIVGVLSDFLS